MAGTRSVCGPWALSTGPIPRAGVNWDWMAPRAEQAERKWKFLCRDAAQCRRALAPYALASATPVDMFPWTANVETVVLLSREKSTQKVRGGFSLEDMDMGFRMTDRMQERV